MYSCDYFSFENFTVHKNVGYLATSPMAQYSSEIDFFMKCEILKVVKPVKAPERVLKGHKDDWEYYLNRSKIDLEHIDQVIIEKGKINEKTNEATVISDLHKSCEKASHTQCHALNYLQLP